MTITTHTIVKNGMPFIPLVLKQVEPFVDRMIVTISIKSNDGTREAIEAIQSPKIELYEENVSNLGELTLERQKQVNMTNSDWIWFLDDDDFWPTESIKEVLALMAVAGDDTDALSVNPYQILDKEHHDANWVNKKYFTKFFKNVNINYRHPWPRDLIYKGDELLYWKVNLRVKNIPIKFYHLAAVKGHSFRKNELTNFNDLEGRPILLKEPLPEEIIQLL